MTAQRSKRRVWALLLLLLVPLLAYPAWIFAKRQLAIAALVSAWQQCRIQIPKEGDSPLRHLQPIPQATCIAHAGGAVGGNRYLNIIEGWEASVSAGARFIEADMLFTTDNHVVLAHDWDHFHKISGGTSGPVSLAEFKSRRLYGKYHPSDWNDAQAFLLSHPGVMLISDTKESNSRLLGFLATTTVKRQIIPQLYHPAEIADAIATGPWTHVIFSAYKHPYPPDLLQAIATEIGCAITMPITRVDPELAGRFSRSGIRLLVHPVEKPADVADLPNVGVYTHHPELFRTPPQ